MTFLVLGSGTAVPDAGRGPAGFVVRTDSADVLVDGGAGTLQRAERFGVHVPGLAGGVYSHRHVDHTGDLVPLFFAFRVLQREVPYPLFAGEGFADFLEQLRGVYGKWIEGWPTPVTELPLSGPGRAQLPGDVTLDTRPANHSAGALHLSFTSAAGSRVVFSGDTGPSPALAELATGADLLVCECALDEVDPRDAHLWPEAVAALVDQARPTRVALTHLYPDTDPSEALRIVGSTGVWVERAEDGSSYAL